MKPAHLPWRLGAGAMLAVGTAGSMLTLSVAAPADGASGPQPAKAAVAQGIDPASLPASRVFPTPNKTKETVSFVLKVRNLSSLELSVNRGMPGGFLSVRQFASRYGQLHSRISALEHFLAHYGLKPVAYADGLDVTVSGTAAQFDNALSVRQLEYRVKAIPSRDGQAGRPAVTIHGTTDKPLLPRTLASFVDSIVGLTNYPLFTSNAVHTLTPEARSAPHGLQIGNRTPQSFASQYHLTSLYASGAKGQGQTIGIITYAALKPPDAAHFWSKTLNIRTKAGRIKLDNIDGGSGPVSEASGSGETTLDVEQSGALAPDASIVVYQAPNTDSGSADAFFAVASQNRATSVSTSWGQSEILNKVTGAAGQAAATYSGIFDEAYLEMAAQGQTAFDTAGDSGAYDDTQDYPLPYTNLSVDSPGDSPWVTTAGGTTDAGNIPLYTGAGILAATVHIAAQRTWGWDWLFPYYALFDNGTQASEAQYAADPVNAWGGGGGYSVTEIRPPYQSRIRNLGTYTAVPYLTPATPKLFPGTSNIYLPTTFTAWDTNSTDPAAPPALITGHGAGRAVPDVVADADPYTGYEEYYSGFPASVGYLEYGWGGTSFVAPQLNGAAAVIDSYVGHRLGFWNPAIYKFAAGRRSPFSPLNSASASNDNLYYTGSKGHIFNPGSGLGVPNLARLAADFRGSS